MDSIQHILERIDTHRAEIVSWAARKGVNLPVVSGVGIVLIILVCVVLHKIFDFLWLSRPINTGLKKYKWHHSARSPVPGEGISYDHMDSFDGGSQTMAMYSTLPASNNDEKKNSNGNKMLSAENPRAKAKTTLKGVVIFNCGYGSHQNRYGHFAKQLSDNGYAVYGIDYPHCGNSSGRRNAYIASWQTLVDDIISFSKHVRSKYSNDTPFYIAGQSLGAVLSVACTLQEPNLYDGMLLIAPAFQIAGVHNCFVQTLLKVASCFCSCFSTGGALDKSSRNLNVKDERAKDKLSVNSDPDCHTAGQITSLLQYVNHEANNVTTPFLITHGSKDLVCPIEGSNDFLLGTTKVPFAKKKLCGYRSAWHDLLHEPEYDSVIQRNIQFMDRHTRLTFLVSSLD